MRPFNLGAVLDEGIMPMLRLLLLLYVLYVSGLKLAAAGSPPLVIPPNEGVLTPEPSPGTAHIVPCPPAPCPSPMVPAPPKIRVVVPPPKITYRQAPTPCVKKPCRACQNACTTSRCAPPAPPTTTVTTTVTAPFNYAIPYQTYAPTLAPGVAAPMHYSMHSPHASMPYPLAPMASLGCTPLASGLFPQRPGCAIPGSLVHPGLANLFTLQALNAQTQTATAVNQPRASATTPNLKRQLREQAVLLASIAAFLERTGPSEPSAQAPNTPQITDAELTETFDLLAKEIQALKTRFGALTATSQDILVNQNRRVEALESRVTGRVNSLENAILDRFGKLTSSSKDVLFGQEQEIQQLKAQISILQREIETLKQLQPPPDR